MAAHVRPEASRDVVLTASSDRVVVEGSNAGTVVATGERYDHDWVVVFTVKDGRVVRFRHFYDPGDLEMAMGGGALRVGGDPVRCRPTRRRPVDGCVLGLGEGHRRFREDPGAVPGGRCRPDLRPSLSTRRRRRCGRCGRTGSSRCPTCHPSPPSERGVSMSKVRAEAVDENAALRLPSASSTDGCERLRRDRCGERNRGCLIL